MSERLESKKGLARRQMIALGAGAALSTVIEACSLVPRPIPTPSHRPTLSPTPEPTPKITPLPTQAPRQRVVLPENKVSFFVDTRVVNKNWFELNALSDGIKNIDTFYFFAMNFDPDSGNLLHNENYQAFDHPKTQQLLKKVKDAQKRRILTIALFDTDPNHPDPEKRKSIVKPFLANNNQKARDNFVKQVMDEIKKRDFNGLCIDVESWHVFGDPLLQHNFVEMVGNLHTRIHQEIKNLPQLTVAIPTGATDSQMFAYPETLYPKTDGLLLMTYDYFQPNRSLTEMKPNAPQGISKIEVV